MTKFLERCRGAGGKRPAHPGVRAVLLGGLGGFLAIGALAFLSGSLDVLLLLGSFGASCVLLFGYPDAPFRATDESLLAKLLAGVFPDEDLSSARINQDDLAR
jgi:CBS-domain-containing membrane protein